MTDVNLLYTVLVCAIVLLWLWGPDNEDDL